MFQLFKLSFDKNFSSRKNGVSSLEEAEEKKSNRKVNDTEKVKGVLKEEATWDAKDLEAKAAVKFKSATFFKDLIYHIFYPLSIPLMMCLDGGVYALQNRFFVPTKGAPIGLVFAQLALGICFYTFNGVSLFFVIRGKHLDFLYDVALVDICWIMRNAVVATKYAFASEVDIKKMRVGVLDVRHRVHQTVLGGWADPLPRKVVKQELLLAAVRCRLFLTNHAFKLDTSVDSYEAMRDMISDLHLGKEVQDAKEVGTPHRAEDEDVLGESNKWLKMGRDECLLNSGSSVRPNSLPVRLYAAHVICQSSSLSRLRRVGHTVLSQHLRWCAFVVSIVVTSLPFILRGLLGGHGFSGPNWSIWVVACTAFVMLYFSMYSNIAFMMVGILDLRRRHYVAMKLDELLRTGVYTGSQHVRNPALPRSFRTRSLTWLRSINSQSSSRSSTSGSDRSSLAGQGIVLDFCDVRSLQAWWKTRMLVHNFGLGFFKRIKYYTTYFACYCGVLILLIGLRLLKGIKKEDIYILVSVVVCLDAFLTLLALMVWPGGDINTMRQVQGATLTQSKLRMLMTIHQEKDDLSPEELKDYQTVMHTMSSISEAVRWDNDKHKISVCGFQAGEQLLSLIVAILTASVAIGAGQIVANVVNTRAN